MNGCQTQVRIQHTQHLYGMMSYLYVCAKNDKMYAFEEDYLDTNYYDPKITFIPGKGYHSVKLYVAGSGPTCWLDTETEHFYTEWWYDTKTYVPADVCSYIDGYFANKMELWGLGIDYSRKYATHSDIDLVRLKNYIARLKEELQTYRNQLSA